MRHRLFLLAATLLFAAPALGQNPRVIDWVENGPAEDPDTIALGYPVPIPVNTPMPFTGFRTYEGLHTRHQDLANTTPWAHPEQVGITRYGRPIWAYRLGDADLTRPDGIPEQAMLTNGGIHAREWQSPEVATGVLELIAGSEADNHLISYLRDNANVIVIPVLNIDGFLQTQRYPGKNWIDTDPNDPTFSPRDGRMRRKNLLNADEDLFTQGDHLNGVDLNRNNAPYWSTNPGRSSPSPLSLVHHGAQPASEPETQALDAAAQLGPADQLSMYTDLHSFSQVHFWVRNNNDRLATLTERLLKTFTDHHIAFPAGKWYAYAPAANVPINQGIGSTDEYFTHTYQVPSWTLEIEPTGGQAYHAPLPGVGADYGGLARNGHDGFILPDSEVPRVRTQMAQSFAMAYYQQSGPPTTNALKIVDLATDAVVYQADWEPTSDTERSLHAFQAQPIQLGRDYRVWMAHDKPMRWRDDDMVVPAPGQPGSSLDVDVTVTVGGEPLVAGAENVNWLSEPGFAPDGYLRYRDDALAVDASLFSIAGNVALIDGEAEIVMGISLTDFVNQRTDADPSTVARWANGAWAGYEDDQGSSTTDSGGHSSWPMQISSEALGDPFVVEAGTSSAWYDPERDGEGFVLEVLENDRAVMYWFTYNDEGGQDWYIAVGEIIGNRVLFPEVLQIFGGVFGPDYDPDLVTETVVGSASFIWSDCDHGAMQWQIGSRKGRMDLLRLSRVMGIDCGAPQLPPLLEQALRSGSWYDPSHNGEGYTLEVLVDQRVVVYWFGFGPNGERRWFFGIGSINGQVFEFEEMLTTTGARFGAEFDSDDVQVLPWGSMEIELDCEGGESRFEPTEDGFAPGELDLTRLSALEGLDC